MLFDIEVWQTLGLILGICFVIFAIFLGVVLVMAPKKNASYSPALPTIEHKAEPVEVVKPFEGDKFTPTMTRKSKTSALPTRVKLQSAESSAVPSTGSNTYFADQEDDFEMTSGRD